MKKLIVALLAVGLVTSGVYGYGGRGHGLVGAIADKRLASNATVAATLRDLLDGVTLERAATLPDDIKTAGFRLSDHPTIDAQLRDFVTANPASGPHSHLNFHFTDVPVMGNESYAPADGVGRSEFDIVHMIPFCIGVLKGQVDATNDHKITRAIAVILLAHYFGDIHQPLHVGAEYFDSAGKAFEPTTDNRGFSDQGGNKLNLFLRNGNQKVAVGKLHTYWDNDTVKTAFGRMNDARVAELLAGREPENWKLTGAVETWAETLANEIMPLAREAHERLEFSKIKPIENRRLIPDGGVAEEKAASSGPSYKSFAGKAVGAEIHKAGWRLAALLEEILR